MKRVNPKSRNNFTTETTSAEIQSYAAQINTLIEFQNKYVKSGNIRRSIRIIVNIQSIDDNNVDFHCKYISTGDERKSTIKEIFLIYTYQQ